MTRPYQIEVCFVIDCSANMQSLLPWLKPRILGFEKTLRNQLDHLMLEITGIGIRVITFCGAQGGDHPRIQAMRGFASLPHQAAELQKFVETIETAAVMALFWRSCPRPLRPPGASFRDVAGVWSSCLRTGLFCPW
ncbi:MAG: hypothetical protein HYU59_04940 [Magnetospirillum gryphiswaldense]|nr:hypothetical protein [Magnetospirillum gryphiswaldense]